MIRIGIFLIFFSSALKPSSSNGPEIPDQDEETMVYVLKYSGLNVGRAIVSYRGDSAQCGTHIKAEARATGLGRIFSSMNYQFECCMDPETGLPRNSIKNLVDRKFDLYNEVIYDHDSREDSSIVYSQLSGRHVVTKPVYDILTGYNHFRKNLIAQCTSTDNEVVITTYLNDGPWDLRLRYAGKETIRTRYGPPRCIKFIPSTIAGKFFRNENDMSIWFTDDEYHIPIRIRLNLKIGSIQGNLTDYQNPRLGSTDPFIKD